MTKLIPKDGETWRMVPGFPDYSVSDLGRFARHIPGRTCYELSGKVDRTGYQQIGLVRQGKQHWLLAHRVVACAFLSIDALSAKAGSFLTVNHKDRNKLNNALSNLELMTVAQNHQHWRKNSLAKMANG